MAEEFPGLVVAYVGPNAAHRRFRTAIANAKALAFVLTEDNARVLHSFLEQADGARRRSPDGTFAIGKVGRASTTSAQLAIHITSNEIDLTAGEPGGFVSQALGLVYREIYSVFETFVVDLFEEIAYQEKRILYSRQAITHEEALGAANLAELQKLIIDQRKSELTRIGFTGLDKVFEGFGLPIVPMTEPPPIAQQEDVARRLHLLSAARNVIEHNRSVVNAEFVALVADSPHRIGDRIAIREPELGDALSAVEWTADQLNRRAIEKFKVA
jgi:hypothetical protein